MQFRVLGPLEVEDDGEPLRLAGAKQRTLLALLLLRANHVVSRDTLIEGLWGDSPPRGAEHSLETHVFRLRKLLHKNGQDLVLTRLGGYILELGEAKLDLDRFEGLADEGRAALRAGDAPRAAALVREALSLWRGQPLEGTDIDSFAVAELQAMEDRRLSAHEDLIEAELEQGHNAEVLLELERLVRLNPLRERFHAQLMVALYRCGRQADALEAYRNARRRFASELGIEPGPELRELEQAILQQHDKLAAPVPSAAPNPDRAPPRSHRRLAAAAIGAAAVVAGGLAVALTGGGTPRAPAHVDANAVGVIDPRTGGIAEQVPLGGAPSHFAVGNGAVWVTNADGHMVLRIDPHRWIRVQKISVGDGPSGIAIGKGAVWVADSFDGTVSRIDPGTDEVVQRILVGDSPEGVAFGSGSIWVANAADGTITRIDAVTGKRQRTIDVAANELAYGDHALWATDSSANTVWRIDPTTNMAVQPIAVGNGPAGLAFGNGSLWVANKLDGTVSQVDPRTNSIAGTVHVGGSPNGIDVGDEGAWVTDESGEAVVRIDPHGHVVQRVGVGNHPTGLAVDDASGRVLVGVRPSGAGHRGGKLTLSANFIASIDPAVAYGVNEWSVLNVTGDGLTAFDRTDGGSGTLVPDLAVSLPTPTSFGKTYTFRVRRNIRYSSGRLVKASDIRYAIERDFRFGSASPSTGFFQGVVGASACDTAPRHCELSKGIVVNDSAGTVTFHLTRPDPELLYKLAMPFAYAVPAGTPARDIGRYPLPATGPYVIAAYRPKHSLKLVRNPHFEEWSEAAQPDGHPDEIIVRIGVGADRTIAAVENGHADGYDSWGPGGPPADRLRELRTRFASQLHVNPRPVTVGFFLNPHLPPFDDVRVRRAVNYAANRALAVNRIGGPEAGRPTCQILPPNFPGYEPYCPYTAQSRGDGAWVAPDLARARKLVAAAKTKGERVTVWFDKWAWQWFGELGPYMTSLLRSLGYQPSVRFAPNENTRGHQIGFVAWAADYPSAWDFLTPLTCGSWSQFCDPSIDREEARALEAEATDPEGANLRWARIDRHFVDEAAWLPLVTPRWIDFLSTRVGNYEENPQWGMLIDQLWVH